MHRPPDHDNKSVFSFLRTLTTWHCPRSHAVATERGRAAIDISCPLGPQQQTCRGGFCCCGPCWDRRTDTYRYIDPALHTIYGQCQIKAIQIRGFARTAAVSLIFRSPTWSIFRGVARTSIMRQRPSVFRRPTGCRGAASWCPAGWVVGPHGHRHAVRRRSITWAAACTGRRRFSELVLRTTGRRGDDVMVSSDRFRTAHHSTVLLQSLCTSYFA